MTEPLRRPGDPVPASEQVRARFQSMPRKDTKPELALRRELHRRGVRYRVGTAPLTGLRRRADVVFTAARVAVFVDGCFWHSCHEHGTRPRNNADWWAAKLDRVVARDRDTDRALLEAGWAVVRVWEHEPADRAADTVVSAVAEARRRRGGPEATPASAGL